MHPSLHRRRQRANNVSPRTKANNTTHRQPAEHAYAIPDQQPAYQGGRRTTCTTPGPSRHNTRIQATKVATVDKQGPAPAEAKVGASPDCTQIRNRGAGATPRRPKAIGAHDCWISWIQKSCTTAGRPPSALQAWRAGRTRVNERGEGRLAHAGLAGQCELYQDRRFW